MIITTYPGVRLIANVPDAEGQERHQIFELPGGATVTLAVTSVIRDPLPPVGTVGTLELIHGCGAYCRFTGDAPGDEEKGKE